MNFQLSGDSPSRLAIMGSHDRTANGLGDRLFLSREALLIDQPRCLGADHEPNSVEK